MDFGIPPVLAREFFNRPNLLSPRRCECVTGEAFVQAAFKNATVLTRAVDPGKNVRGQCPPVAFHAFNMWSAIGDSELIPLLKYE